MEKIADLAEIDELILKLKDIQDKADRKFWNVGLFPSFRFNKFWFYFRKDNSIFYTALIVKILQDIYPYLTIKNKILIDEIIDKSTLNYSDYENSTGQKTYNFYPTKPSRHFANGLLFRHLKHFQLPDDADDTALIYNTNAANNIEIEWLRNKLKLHANVNGKARVGIAKNYNNWPAYSTWFGKNMPIEFDVVVHCNILALFLKNKIQLDENALASWEFVKECILSKKYETNPFAVSANYANSITIAYFVAPILRENLLPESENVAVILKKFLSTKIKEIKINPIENAMAYTTLIKLGDKSQLYDNEANKFENTKKFSLFLAGMLSAFTNSYIQKLASYPFFHIRWKCEAHSLAILLEAQIYSEIGQQKNT